MEGLEAMRKNLVVQFVAVCDLLFLVSLQAQQLDLQGLMTEAFARSAEMPYAELGGTHDMGRKTCKQASRASS